MCYNIDVKNLNYKHIQELRTGTKGLAYTWHESEDLFSGFLVKTELHSTIPHLGGKSIVANLIKQGNIKVRKDLYNAINKINKEK